MCSHGPGVCGHGPGVCGLGGRCKNVGKRKWECEVPTTVSDNRLEKSPYGPPSGSPDGLLRAKFVVAYTTALSLLGDAADPAVQEMKASIVAAYDLWYTAVDTRVDNECFDTSARLTALAGYALGVLYGSTKKTPGCSDGSCEYLDEFKRILAWLEEVGAAVQRSRKNARLLSR